MMTKRSRYFIILFSLIALGVVILLGGMITFLSLFSRVQIIDRDAAAVAHQCAVIQKGLKSEKGLIDERDGLLRDLATLDWKLADYRYIPTYLAQIQRAATSTGNTIMSIQPSELKPLDLAKLNLAKPLTLSDMSVTAKPRVVTTAQAGATGDGSPVQVKKARYQIIAINLTITGDFHSLMQFLDALRNFRKMIRVRTLTITPDTSDGKVKVTTRIETEAVIAPEQYVPAPKTGSAEVNGPDASVTGKEPSHEK